jgi:hypothetical protein
MPPSVSFLTTSATLSVLSASISVPITSAGAPKRLPRISGPSAESASIRRMPRSHMMASPQTRTTGTSIADRRAYTGDVSPDEEGEQTQKSRHPIGGPTP